MSHPPSQVHVELSRALHDSLVLTNITSYNSSTTAGGGVSANMHLRRAMELAPLVDLIRSSSSSGGGHAFAQQQQQQFTASNNSTIRLVLVAGSSIGQSIDPFDMFLRTRHGNIGIVVSLFASMKSPTSRQMWEEEVLQRMTSPRLGVTDCRVRCWLVVMSTDDEEPQLDALTWINVRGVQYGVQVQVVWSWDEAHKAIVGLASPSPFSGFSGAAARGGGGGGGGGSLDVLISSLSTHGNLPLTRQDVIRAANRCTTVADMLAMNTESWMQLPSIGHKKANGIRSVLNVPFPTTDLRLDDVMVMALGQEEELEKTRRSALLPEKEKSSFSAHTGRKDVATVANTSSVVLPTTAAPRTHSTAFNEALQAMLSHEEEDTDVSS